jgi:hypothetical protein
LGRIFFTQGASHLEIHNKAMRKQIETMKALRRIEVKVENMKLEFKATGHPRKYDMDELLSLIEVVSRNMRGKVQ